MAVVGRMKKVPDDKTILVSLCSVPSLMSSIVFNFVFFEREKGRREKDRKRKGRELEKNRKYIPVVRR